VLQCFIKSIRPRSPTKNKIENEEQKNSRPQLRYENGSCAGISDVNSSFQLSAQQKQRLKELYHDGLHDAATRPSAENNSKGNSRKRSLSQVDNEPDDAVLQTSTSKRPKTLDTTHDIITKSRLSSPLVSERLERNNHLPINERQGTEFANQSANTGERSKIRSSLVSGITYPDKSHK
jgi:hypothetical protein